MRRRIQQMLVFAGLLAGTVHAQDISGTWQGIYNAGSDQHRTLIKIVKNDRGDWQATELSIEFVHDDLNVDSLSLSGAEVKFTVNGGKGSYDGEISADGSSFSGTWNFDGHSVPLEFRRATKETAWHTPFQYQYHLKNVTYARPSPDEPKIAFTPRLAVDYLEEGAVAWTKEWQCVSCHTNGSYMVVRPLLSAQLGQPNKELRNFFVSALRQQLTAVPDDPKNPSEPTQVVYIAAGLAIWDANVTHQLSLETSQALALMFKLQGNAGGWFIEDDNNPPLESSTYQLATVAARAVGNAPGWLAQQRGTPVEQKVSRLLELLRSGRALQGDYDRTDLLWAATEFPGLLDDTRKQELIQMILKHQKPDGGWSMRTFASPEEWGKGNRADKLRREHELADPPSDGHMTGLAIIALRKAGVPASDPQIRRGVQWLLANQRASGRWWTRSLNRDGWQFITYSGTAYPLLALALCDALPHDFSVSFPGS